MLLTPFTLADTDNDKVQVFMLSTPSSTMCYVYFIDFKEMQRPFGVCYTNTGLVWVTAANQVLVFKEDGAFSTACKLEDEGPAGITATSKGEIVIVFSKSRKLVCYAHNMLS